jgi:hypothetical protein
MVASIQTFGGQGANWHPHVHAIVTGGVFLPDGTFLPVPPPDPEQLMLLFRHKVIKRLLAMEKITEATVEILNKFRHPGFSVHQGWPILPQDAEGRAKLAAYILHPPIALDRLTYGPDSGGVLYRPKPAPPGAPPSSPPVPPGAKVPSGPISFDPLDFLAAATSHIPNKGQQLLRYFG